MDMLFSDEDLSFREEVRAFFKENLPETVREVVRRTPSYVSKSDMVAWHKALYRRGWIAPAWPVEYGGIGWSVTQRHIFEEEYSANDAPRISGFGITMVGPVIYTFGTQAQKDRYLPNILSGDELWCQGYSEPGSGSDLASLRTRAEDAGDHFVINGQKIWTSGAQFADWIFCLVRTDPDAPKHDGISFVLFSMDQPGVSVRPIQLISGASPFCETFFDNAIAQKTNLVGDLNKGWTVAKRLLQHERSGMLALTSGTNREVGIALDELAKACLGEIDGKIGDSTMRAKITMHDINTQAFRLTQRRTVEESEGSTPGPATSIFKLYGANLAKSRSEMQVAMLGTKSIGWETDNSGTLEITRSWLAGKARSIAGGSNEVQLNIIAKRVLGLPD